MTLTGKNVIVGMILLGMVVAGLSTFVSDTSDYYDSNPNSTYESVYSEATDIIENMSSLTQNIYTKTEGEGGLVGTIVQGIIAIPQVLWSIFMLIIVTPIMLATTLLGSVLGLVGIGSAGATWIITGIEAIIIVSIVFVFIRARFRYNV